MPELVSDPLPRTTKNTKKKKKRRKKETRHEKNARRDKALRKKRDRNAVPSEKTGSQDCPLGGPGSDFRGGRR